MSKVFAVALEQADGQPGRTLEVLADNVQQTLEKAAPHLQEGETVVSVNPTRDVELIV